MNNLIMMYRTGIGFLLLFWACMPNLLAQGEAVSLQEAIEIAFERTYNLKIAKQSQQIASNNDNWGAAGRYPTISANLNNSNTYNNINNPTSFLDGAQILGTNATLSLDAQWVLYDGGRIKITKERLALLVEQSGVDAKVIMDNIIQQVSKAYMNVLVQEQRLQALGKVLQLSRDKIKYVEARREFGQATEFDMLQIKDAYLNDSIQWVLQQTNHQNAKENLALAMGLEVQADLQLSLKDTLSYDLPDYAFESMQEEVLNRNKQIRAEQLKLRLSELDIRLQEANRNPRLSFNGNISEQVTLSQVNGKQPQIPNDWLGGSTFSGALNFSLSYTLYDGGRIHRGIENAKINRQIANLNLNNLELQLTQQLKIAYNLYQNQKGVLALSQQLLDNAERNLSIAEERFEASTLNYFDFRTIQINYIRSLNAVQDAFLNAKNTELDLLLLTGTLVEEEE